MTPRCAAAGSGALRAGTPPRQSQSKILNLQKLWETVNMCPVPGPRVLGSSVMRQSLTCDPPGGHRLQRRRELPAAAGGGRGPGAGARGPPRCLLSLCPFPLWAAWVICPSQDVGESRGTLTPRVLAGLQPPGLGARSNLGSAHTLQTCYHRERPRGPERCLAPPGSPPGRPWGSAPSFPAVVGQSLFISRMTKASRCHSM